MGQVAALFGVAWKASLRRKHLGKDSRKRKVEPVKGGGDKWF